MLIDLDRLKQDADLLAIIDNDTELKKVANTAGGEYAGACPFCGGRDRFHVQPYAKPFPLWLCRRCGGGKWDTVIGYIARRDKLNPKKYDDLAEICRRLTGGEFPITSSPRSKNEPTPEPGYGPPSNDWQNLAKKIIKTCKANLWDDIGKKALKYLKERGLSERTISHFNLGYSTGYKHYEAWVPRGVLIPCIVADKVWYLKIRLPAKPGGQKYTLVTGSRPKAIYNADALLKGLRMALFCEGEFDCMIANQEFGDVMPTVTLGSSTNLPDLATWGPYLLPLQLILIAFDTDQAGRNGAAALNSIIGKRMRLAPLPEGLKDINEFCQAGGDLMTWIMKYKTTCRDPFFNDKAS